MDEMNIKLGSKLMKGLVSKMMARSIYKKTGYKVSIDLDDLDVKFIDGETSLKLNIRANLKTGEFMKLIKNLELDQE